MLDGAYVLYWTVNLDTSTLDMTITAKTNGWVGWGVSPEGTPEMLGSEAVIGHLSSPASTATVYRLNQRDASQFTNITSQIPLNNTMACTFTNGGATWSLVQFSRPLTGGNNPISLTGQTAMAIAYGSNGILSQHASNARTPFFLDLVNPPAAPTAGPVAPTSTPTAAPSTPTAPQADSPVAPTPSSASALLTVTAVFFVALAALIAVAF